MKRIYGYGYKFKGESILEALEIHLPNYLHKSKKSAQKAIRCGEETGEIDNKAKPQIFKVIIEVVEE